MSIEAPSKQGTSYDILPSNHFLYKKYEKRIKEIKLKLIL